MRSLGSPPAGEGIYVRGGCRLKGKAAVDWSCSAALSGSVVWSCWGALVSLQDLRSPALPQGEIHDSYLLLQIVS